MTAIPALGRRLGRVLSDTSETSEQPGAIRIRRAMATLFCFYGTVLCVMAVTRGEVPSLSYVIIFMAAASLCVNRGGSFVRYWLPVLLGLYAYGVAGAYAQKLKFGVHYLPQIDIERVISLGGTLPTTWLQEHLYHGHTDALAIAASITYLSHFFVPFLFAFYLWWRQRKDAFTALMFGLLTVSILGEITFVLAPTAPPWMAAQEGLIPPVHHVIKQALFDMHFTKAAEFYGNSANYNTVAAMPSLHAAWPIVSYLVARNYGLPRWTRAVLAAQWLAIVFAIVYTGEHYLADAVVAVPYALAASWLVGKALVRSRGHEKGGSPVTESGLALPGSVPAPVTSPGALPEPVEG
ncbi:MAG TPA: phosphatase PAP2 family protein [Thermoleophilaceae bacterium]